MFEYSQYFNDFLYWLLASTGHYWLIKHNVKTIQKLGQHTLPFSMQELLDNNKIR